MYQQINLYRPVSRQEHKQFSSAPVVVIFGVVVVALAAFSVHAMLGVERLEQQVATLRQQQKQQQEQLAEAGALRSAHGTVAEAEARVQALTTMLAERTSALQVLQSGRAGQTTGFAARMEALARRHVAGLWIDTLLMSGTSGSMSLAGGTVDPDILPAYLHGLSSEAALSGTRFDDFIIERPPPAVDDETQQAAPGSKRKPAVDHVRFRAGNRSLAAAQSKAAT